MVKVLIFGSTGYVGTSLSLSLVQSGHTVLGQTRSPSKFKDLQKNEITPIVGEPTDSSIFGTIIKDVDVVINAIGGAAKDLSDPIFDLALSSLSHRTTPLGYLSISGVWVYGDSRSPLISETSALSPSTAVPIVSWRVTHDARLLSTSLSNPLLRVLIVRSSLVFGGSSIIANRLFGQAKEGETIKWPGKGEGREGAVINMVHRDDLADVVRRGVENIHSVNGLAIVATTNKVPIEVLLSKLVKVSGAKGWEYVEPSNPIEVALNATADVHATLARDLLGWTGKKVGLVEGLEGYWQSWKAAQ